MNSSSFSFRYFVFQAALDFLLTRNDINSSKIVVFGRSLGGAVGAHLLKDNPHKVRVQGQ